MCFERQSRLLMKLVPKLQSKMLRCSFDGLHGAVGPNVTAHARCRVPLRDEKERLSAGVEPAWIDNA